MTTIKRQIVQVSTLQSAKVAAGLYFVISIPIVLLLAVVMALLGQGGISVELLVVFPLLQMVCGFLFALLAGWIYNMVTSRIGGFEFMTAEVGAASQQ
jgi:hypothetical protein